MDRTGLFKSSGIAIGIMIGLVLCVILFKYMNKDRKIMTKYDERQIIARGKAYMYGFWAMIIAATAVMLLDMAGIVIASSLTKYFFILFVGMIAQITYSIKHDAYFGINNNKKRFAIICIAAAICNLLGVIGPIVGGEFIKDGMISDSGTNLLCFILMVTVGVELFIKSRKENAENASEESGDDE